MSIPFYVLIFQGLFIDDKKTAEDKNSQVFNKHTISSSCFFDYLYIHRRVYS